MHIRVTTTTFRLLFVRDACPDISFHIHPYFWLLEKDFEGTKYTYEWRDKRLTTWKKISSRVQLSRHTCSIVRISKFCGTTFLSPRCLSFSILFLKDYCKNSLSAMHQYAHFQEICNKCPICFLFITALAWRLCVAGIFLSFLGWGNNSITDLFSHYLKCSHPWSSSNI